MAYACLLFISTCLENICAVMTMTYSGRLFRCVLKWSIEDDGRELECKMRKKKTEYIDKCEWKDNQEGIRARRRYVLSSKHFENV